MLRYRAFALLAALVPLPAIHSAAHAGPSARAHLAAHKAKLHLQVPTSVDAGTGVYFVVKSAPRVLVHLRVSYDHDASNYTAAQRTGNDGSATFSYSAPYVRQMDRMLVKVRAVVAGRHLVTLRAAIVIPFMPRVGIGQLQVLVHETEAWAPATQVTLGEDVHFVASYGVFEPAGSFFPSCVTGTLRVVKGTATVFSAPVQCPAAQPQNSPPYVYVDTRFTDGSATGPLTAELDLSYDEGPYGVARGTATAEFTLHT